MSYHVMHTHNGLPVSRQYAWQWRKRDQGLCSVCGWAPSGGLYQSLCDHCGRQRRDYARRVRKLRLRGGD